MPRRQSEVTIEEDSEPGGALALIDEMQEIAVLGITEERKREETYKNALKTCDCKNW